MTQRGSQYTQSAPTPVRVEIRTSDPRFTEQGRDGRVVVHGTETGRLTIAATGHVMVEFQLDARHPIPRDAIMKGRSMFAPITWLVS